MQYTVVDVDGRVRRVVDIPVGGPVSIHDMSLTSSYAVIYDLPVVFSPEALAEGFSFPYRWSEGTRAGSGSFRSRAGRTTLCGVMWIPVTSSTR